MNWTFDQKPPARERSESGVPGSATEGSLARELSQRVKNNLQIIVSLMNLKQRSLAPDRREDIRFLQEQVQCMAVAYRLIYVAGATIEVPLHTLLSEVVSELRQISRLRTEQLQVSLDVSNPSVGLDRATALSLYLAVILPPYFDLALRSGGSVSISGEVVEGGLRLSIAESGEEPPRHDAFRARLRDAYTAQLRAEILPPGTPSGTRCQFKLAPLSPPDCS